jgi:pimeloyl-ACP methyl ester carboxylesterase
MRHITLNIPFIILLLASITCAAHTQPGIDTTAAVAIGGIKQFITIKGTNRANPLLLYITGGPGESSIGQSDTYTGELRKHFVLVEWDQRGCGETQKLNASPAPITLAVCQNDAAQLVDYLLAHFHRQKLFVMGWSWGTVPGFYLAQHYPQKLYAYFAVSPVVNQQESERISLAEMKAKAQKTHNQTALTELAKVKIPFENMNEVFYARKWLFTFNGAPIPDKTLRAYFFAPGSSWIIRLFNEASAHNLTRELPAVQCPVYFFIGKNDNQTYHTIGEAYFKQLRAPKKQLFLFQNSGHAVPLQEPALFQKDMIGTIPAALGSEH